MQAGVTDGRVGGMGRCRPGFCIFWGLHECFFILRIATIPAKLVFSTAPDRAGFHPQGPTLT